jgi:hypothetical protein
MNAGFDRFLNEMMEKYEVMIDFFSRIPLTAKGKGRKSRKVWL